MALQEELSPRNCAVQNSVVIKLMMMLVLEEVGMKHCLHDILQQYPQLASFHHCLGL